MRDLKVIYAAVDEPATLEALENFSETWDTKYPSITVSWKIN